MTILLRFLLLLLRSVSSPKSSLSFPFIHSPWSILFNPLLSSYLYFLHSFDVFFHIFFLLYVSSSAFSSPPFLNFFFLSLSSSTFHYFLSHHLFLTVSVAFTCDFQYLLPRFTNWFYSFIISCINYLPFTSSFPLPPLWPFFLLSFSQCFSFFVFLFRSFFLQLLCIFSPRSSFTPSLLSSCSSSSSSYLRGHTLPWASFRASGNRVEWVWSG